MTMQIGRRTVTRGLAATGLIAGLAPWGEARAQATQPDTILRNGRFTTLDRANPQADAVAIKDGRFAAVGVEREVMALAGPGTRVVDLNGRRAVPGLIDSHPQL